MITAIASHPAHTVPAPWYDYAAVAVLVVILAAAAVVGLSGIISRRGRRG